MEPVHATPASRYLINLARQNAQVYAALPSTRAIIVTGSAAEGVSDTHSDLDMIVYHHVLPSEEVFLAAAQHNQGIDRKPLGERTEDEFGETYQVRGVECQVGHTTVQAWERDMASVLEQLEVATPLQKALSGMLDAIPLMGEPLIRQWQTRLRAYPDALAKAMVEHYLRFFPLWGLQERLATRDATIWVNSELVEEAQNCLGVLSGLNRLYFTPFQFKRTRQHVQKMRIAPPDLADRLESLFASTPDQAAGHLEQLVSEILTLVEEQMPQVDTSRARARIGWRQQAWILPATDEAAV